MRLQPDTLRVSCFCAQFYLRFVSEALKVHRTWNLVLFIFLYFRSLHYFKLYEKYSWLKITLCSFKNYNQIRFTSTPRVSTRLHDLLLHFLFDFDIWQHVPFIHFIGGHWISETLSFPSSVYYLNLTTLTTKIKQLSVKKKKFSNLLQIKTIPLRPSNIWIHTF